MPITNLSPLNMVARNAFWQGWQLRNPDESPVDLTGFFATATFSRDGAPLLSVPVSIDADNNIELTLTAEQVDTLAGPRVQYEVTILPNADPTAPPAEVWRGSVNVQ